MIDFHSHILPCIDDGSKSIEMTCEMLKNEILQNVDTVIATHHFYYGKTDLDVFLDRVSKGIDITRQVLSQEKLDITILTGAEVYLTPEVPDMEGLERLCIEGTRCILIELPGNEWTQWVYNALYKLKGLGYTPVLAHLERYINYISDKSKIHRLLDMDYVIQINSGDVGRFMYNKIIDAVMKSGGSVVLGTDAHNTSGRPVDFIRGVNAIIRRYGADKADEIELTARELLTGDSY